MWFNETFKEKTIQVRNKILLATQKQLCMLLLRYNPLLTTSVLTTFISILKTFCISFRSCFINQTHTPRHQNIALAVKLFLYFFQSVSSLFHLFLFLTISKNLGCVMSSLASQEFLKSHPHGSAYFSFLYISRKLGSGVRFGFDPFGKTLVRVWQDYRR